MPLLLSINGPSVRGQRRPSLSLSPRPSPAMAGDGTTRPHMTVHVMVRNVPRILVVDDDLPICELLELAFTDEGWVVRVRTRGQDALDLLQRWTADVILLDFRMPEMDAEAFLSRCRSRGPVGRAIPVLLVSASSNLDDCAACLGVSAVVAKPFDIDALRSEEHTSELQSLAYLVCRL